METFGPKTDPILRRFRSADKAKLLDEEISVARFLVLLN